MPVRRQRKRGHVPKIGWIAATIIVVAFMAYLLTMGSGWVWGF